MRYHTVLLTAVMFATTATAHAAGDAAKGGTMASTKCASCHGAHGEGMAKNPKLAGLTAEYIETQLKAYQSGTRQHMMMTGIAKKLSEQDIADVAAFFASQPAK